LQTVAWWYIGPLFGGVLLLEWGITGYSRIAIAIAATIVIVVGAGLVVLNQRAVRNCLQPIRDDLKRLIDTLERPDAS
jgi:hypothetical protein